MGMSWQVPSSSAAVIFYRLRESETNNSWVLRHHIEIVVLWLQLECVLSQRATGISQKVVHERMFDWSQSFSPGLPWCQALFAPRGRLSVPAGWSVRQSWSECRTHGSPLWQCWQCQFLKCPTSFNTSLWRMALQSSVKGARHLKAFGSLCFESKWWVLIFNMYLFHLYCEQSIEKRQTRPRSSSGVESLILTTTSSVVISTLPAESSLIFESEGCCSRRLFYHSAGFNHPSMPNIAEQWVSSVSKEFSVIEFTFSEGFCTCACVSKTCPASDSVSVWQSFHHFPHAQRPSKNNDSGNECQELACFWFYYLSLPRIRSWHFVN